MRPTGIPRPTLDRKIETHVRFHVRFTPTSASWLNMIERFFRDLTTYQIRRGVFQDLEELIAASAITSTITTTIQSPSSGL
jgi:hypothetical protein